MGSMNECLYPDRCLQCPWVFTDECMACIQLEKYGLGKTPWGEYRELPQADSTTLAAE